MLANLHRAKIYLECMRYKVTIPQVGISLLGSLFALSTISPPIILRLILLLLASFCLYAHAFSFNDWCGAPFDKYGSMKKGSPLLSGRISARELLVVSFSLLILSWLIYIFLSIRVLTIAIFLFLISIVYSHPRIFLKGRPILSSLAHFVGGVLQFLLGYSLFSNAVGFGILIGIYFGIVHVAAHLNHEIIDYESDSIAGIRTNALRFGKRKVFFVSFVFFSLSVVYFYMLSLYNFIPWVLILAVLMSYPVYLYLFYNMLKKGIDSENAEMLAKGYRKLYAITGIYMVVFLTLRLNLEA